MGTNHSVIIPEPANLNSGVHPVDEFQATNDLNHAQAAETNAEQHSTIISNDSVSLQETKERLSNSIHCPTAEDTWTEVEVIIDADEDLLGVGGFTRTFTGNDTAAGRKVVVKEFLQHFPNADLQPLLTLQHENVVSILAQNTSDLGGNLQLVFVLPHFSKGNILQFITTKGNPDDDITLCNFALDIATGCQYLHSKSIIHGNLAARNIFVEEVGTSIDKKGAPCPQYRAKVADYGVFDISQPSTSSSHYALVPNGKVVPVRWVPKEILEENGSFSFQSDVWSFGVVLLELWTRGADIPYRECSTTEQVIKCILRGTSPLKVRKPKCPPQIADIMESILVTNASERPSFIEISTRLVECRQLIVHASKQPKQKQSNSTITSKKSITQPDANTAKADTSVTTGTTPKPKSTKKLANTDTSKPAAELPLPIPPSESKKVKNKANGIPPLPAPGESKKGKNQPNTANPNSIPKLPKPLIPPVPKSPKKKKPAPTSKLNRGAFTSTPNLAPIAHWNPSNTQPGPSQQNNIHPPPYTPYDIPPSIAHLRQGGAQREESPADIDLQIRQLEQQIEILKVKKLNLELKNRATELETMMRLYTNASNSYNNVSLQF